MSDTMPFWASLLTLLGWHVSQEFQVVQLDHQGCVIVYTSGFPTPEAAAEYCEPHQAIRRVISVWRDHRDILKRD